MGQRCEFQKKGQFQSAIELAEPIHRSPMEPASYSPLKKLIAMKYNLLKLSFLLAIVVFLTSCQKEEIDTDSTSAQDQSDSEQVMEEMEDDVLLRTIEEGYTSSTNCPTISYQNPAGTFPNVITLDWGTGCTGQDGRFRSGALVVDVSDSYFTAGSVRTITSQNYSVNSWLVEGTRTVTNLGENADGQMQWNVVVNNASITDPDGNVGTWSTDRIRTQIDGAETESLLDDSYEITGTASGVNRNGNSYSAAITVPLIKNFDCRWVSSGQIEITGQGGRTRSLDYGNGDCDNKAIVTFANGSQREITVRR